MLVAEAELEHETDGGGLCGGGRNTASLGKKSAGTDRRSRWGKYENDCGFRLTTGDAVI